MVTTRMGVLSGMLFLLLLAYLSHSWGLWPYLDGIAGVTSPGGNSHKTEDALLNGKASHGEALLMHGLNFEADKMLPLARVFYDLGFQVRVPRLAGHRGRIEETFSDPTKLWIEQFDGFNQDFTSPGVCAGYSMGGLLVVERYLSGALNCGRFVLFAPAFSTYMPGAAARLLQLLLPATLQVPSAIPGDYKHFDRLGLGPTWGVVKAAQRFGENLKNLEGKFIPPGLVFFDPRDKVVDVHTVRSLIEKHFPQWKIAEVHALSIGGKQDFHLITDELHLGADQWRTIEQNITHFLKQ